MRRYGIVTFYIGGEEGARLKKILVEEMNKAGVITISDEKIQLFYEDDLKEQFASSHEFVLNNRSEVRIFKNIAESLKLEDNRIDCDVRFFERDRKLLKWVKGVEKRRKEAERNGKRKKV